MQEILEIDHAEAAMIDEPAREPKLIIGRFGCFAGDHIVPHAEHISLLCVAQHATFASCRIVNWWLTVGRGEGSIAAGLNIGS